jgi:ATP-dependent helicase/nuclease subunit A
MDSGLSEHTKKQFEIICAEWEKQRGILADLLQETAKLITSDNTLHPDLLPVMDKFLKGKVAFLESSDITNYFNFLLDAPPDSVIKKAQSHPLQAALVSLLYFLSEITELNLRKGKQKDNPVKEIIRQIRELYSSFSSLVIFCMQAGFSLSMTFLLEKLQKVYLQKKRAEGVLTFSDVANLSRTILIEQRDIRQGEKEAFNAIMIDEFQDNNDLQKDLLFLLAEKHGVFNTGVPEAKDLIDGKLFFVGDEKQSIYLFRGADVSVFRRLKDEIKSDNLTLKTNYRSTPSLIGAFNALFGGSEFDPDGDKKSFEYPSVFAPSASALPLYEASYTPLKANPETDPPAGTSGHNLSICILNTKNDDDDEDDAIIDDTRLPPNENEARFTAEKIRRLLDGKKYAPKDIAILLRAKTTQYLFEKHLRLLDIPYSCEEITDLFYGGLANDIMSVLSLVARSSDNAAYAEMLRSPFAGLSLSGTALCLSFFINDKNSVPFTDKPLEHLGKADRKKYIQGQKIYQKISKLAQSESISSLISELWYTEGYRYETEWNPKTSVYRELYDYLFHLAAKADAENTGLASFVDYISSSRDLGAKFSDIEIPLDRPDAVHILSIHKSKGLEFPVVFLPNCGREGKKDTGGAVYKSDEAGVVVSIPSPPELRKIAGNKSNFFWELAKKEKKQKRTAELRRLLYVAMTRAEKELYVSGSLAVKNPDETEAQAEDFSIALKKNIEEKAGKKENYIEGDTILDNDTFFGLLLPSVVSHIPEGGLKKSFFNLEEIPVYTEDYVKKHDIDKTRLPNDQKGLDKFFKETSPYYEKARIITTPAVKDNHKTPVSLKREEDGGQENTLPGKNFFVNKEFSGENADKIFKEVDSMLERFSNAGEDSERFNSGSFGTIAHICVEALLNKEDPVIPPNLAGFLTPTEADTLLAAGKELANLFVRSPLGKIAESAQQRASEFPFRSIIKNNAGEEVFISGTIDLFFKDNDGYHVVDFKTDSIETPGIHIAQMSCYFQAVRNLYALPEKKDCRAWLYYLRTGHAVEMTERVSKFNIEYRAFT